MARGLMSVSQVLGMAGAPAPRDISCSQAAMICHYMAFAVSPIRRMSRLSKGSSDAMITSPGMEDDKARHLSRCLT
jgi:hypothetical protein